MQVKRKRKDCTSSTIKTTSVPHSIDANNDQPHLASIPSKTQTKSLQVQLASHMHYKTHTTTNNEYRKQNKHMKASRKKKRLHKFNS